MFIERNNIISEIKWWMILTPIITFIAGLILRTLLDFNLALFFVKYFSWIPVRSLFREKPKKISGDWEIKWEPGGSEGYQNPVDRHGHPAIRQFGRYIYAEFYSRRVKYKLFGRIKGQYIVGDWFEAKDKSGYFGVFQLEIVNSSLLKGIWAGHSQSNRKIRSDELILKKIGKE